MTSLLLLFAVVVVALVVPVPVVALGPGPTFDTLGDAGGRSVVTAGGLPTYPTTGHLNMTTVGVTDGITAVDAARFWVSGDHQLAPRFTLAMRGDDFVEVIRIILDGEEQARVTTSGDPDELIEIPVVGDDALSSHDLLIVRQS